MRSQDQDNVISVFPPRRKTTDCPLPVKSPFVLIGMVCLGQGCGPLEISKPGGNFEIMVEQLVDMSVIT